MNNKFKIFSLISLIGFLALTVGVYSVLAAHNATVTAIPAYAKASTLTPYTINVANPGGAAPINQVVITKPTGYGDITSCGTPSGWTPVLTVNDCTYTGSTIAASANQDFIVTLTTAAATGSTYAWTVVTTDNVAATDSDSPTSKVDAATPITATVTAPANVARYKSGAVPATFTGVFADDASGLGLPINSGTIYIKDVTADKYWTGAAWSLAAASVTWLSTTHAATTDATSSTWTKSASIPANGNYTDGHTYEVVAKAVDNAGNEFTGTPITFVFDTTSPSISSVAWSDVSGDKHINGTDRVIITFSESMDTSTVVVGALNAGLGLSANTFGTVGNGLTIGWTSSNTVLTVTLGTDTTIVSGDTVNPAITVLDVAGNTDNSTATAITDNLAPVLAESAVITGYSYTPSYTFTTSEVGTISYTGDCSSATTSATVGSNTIVYTTLVAGTHYHCNVIVTDAVGNASIPLHVTTFTVGNTSQGSGDAGLTTTTTTVTDTTPPTNTSIVVNSGAALTTSANVTLALGATSATQMMISNDSSFVGASWETYATSKSWTLTTGNGSKTVYAKFRDSALNVSAVVSDAITYSPEASSQTANTPATTGIAGLNLPYANPTTASETAANKTALISYIISLLQAKQTATTVSGLPNGFQFTTTLKQGITGNDIKYLQLFLNSDSSTAIGNSGKETSYFGAMTKIAVGKFQLKYGLVAGTSDSGYGIVGPKTRAKINSLLGL
jgi:hypothetical protein